MPYCTPQSLALYPCILSSLYRLNLVGLHSSLIRIFFITIQVHLSPAHVYSCYSHCSGQHLQHWWLLILLSAFWYWVTGYLFWIPRHSEQPDLTDHVLSCIPQNVTMVPRQPRTIYSVGLTAGRKATDQTTHLVTKYLTTPT